MLTHSQHALLLFIDGCLRAKGVSPSYDEMRAHLNLASKSGIHRLVEALVERGFVKRIPNRARALEVVRMSADRTVASVLAAPGALQVRIVGSIAAGTPVSAIQGDDGSVSIPADMLGPGEYFGLKVKGDSMIDAGILDGDLAIVRRQDIVENGDIVVALIDGEEATLKRLRRNRENIALEAANPAYETRILSASRVGVQGKLVTIYRSY